VHRTRAKTHRQEQKRYPGPTCHRILAQHSRSSTQRRSLSNARSRIPSSWNCLVIIIGFIFANSLMLRVPNSSYSCRSTSNSVNSVWKIKISISVYIIILYHMLSSLFMYFWSFFKQILLCINFRFFVWNITSRSYRLEYRILSNASYLA